MSPFVYANNNPVMFNDPTGGESEPPTGKAASSAGFVGIVTGVVTRSQVQSEQPLSARDRMAANITLAPNERVTPSAPQPDWATRPQHTATATTNDGRSVLEGMAHDGVEQREQMHQLAELAYTTDNTLAGIAIDAAAYSGDVAYGMVDALYVGAQQFMGPARPETITHLVGSSTSASERLNGGVALISAAVFSIPASGAGAVDDVANASANVEATTQAI